MRLEAGRVGGEIHRGAATKPRHARGEDGAELAEVGCQVGVRMLVVVAGFVHPLYLLSGSSDSSISANESRIYEADQLSVPVEAEPDKRFDCQPLAQAAIHWGDPTLVAELRDLEALGYFENPFGGLLRPESEAVRLADPYHNILDRLRVALIETLKTEELIAFAFNATPSATAPRERIHPGRWRVLTPNYSDNTASGGGLQLYDVLVVTPYHPAVTETANLASPAILVKPAAPKWILSINKKNLRQGSEKCDLPERQFQLLRFLVERLNMGNPIVSSREIHAHIFNSETSNDAVRQLVRALRDVLNGFRPRLGDELIQNRHGLGYSLDLEVGEIDTS